MREVAGLFLRLGATAFGGPAAHIAMMEDEAVRRRGWIDEKHFLDLVAVTHLVPGPNSTEMAIHLGYLRAGWRGLLLGGACFIAPAFAIVLVLAAAYRAWGTLPAAEALLYGVKPAVLAVIALALWRLGRKALAGAAEWGLGLLVFALAFTPASKVLLLLAAGVCGFLWWNRRRIRDRLSGFGADLPAALAPLPLLAAGGTAPAWSWIDHADRLPRLFLFFLKVGCVLFGSGYVLIAFLEDAVVGRFGWLTNQQLLDAVAVGQMTPGPVLTTSTFIGYQVAGLAGALAATVGIFLPSFAIVVALSRVMGPLRSSEWADGFLRGANAGVVGLMAAVLVQLAGAAFPGIAAVLLGAACAAALFLLRAPALWVVPAAGLAGVLLHLAGVISL